MEKIIYPIKEIPKNVKKENIFYGECFKMYDNSLYRAEEENSKLVQKIKNFYLFEKCFSNLSKDDANYFLLTVFWYMTANFKIENNKFDIQFPNLYLLFFNDFIQDNKLNFKMEFLENKEEYYFQFKILN